MRIKGRLFTKKYMMMILLTILFLTGFRMIWSYISPTNSNFAFILQAITGAIFLLHFIYAILFCLLGQKSKELLYFAFMVFATGVSILLDDNQVLLTIIPIPDRMVTKLLIISFLCISYFTLLFTKELSKKFNQKRITYILSILYSIVLLILIMTPIKDLSSISAPFFLLNIFAFLYAFYMIFRIANYENPYAFPLVFAAICNVSNVVWGVLFNAGVVHFYFYPFDYILAIIAFAIFLFKQSFVIFEERKQLTNTLEKINREKDDFLANTSHELRNPLHGMINIAEAIKKDHTENLDKSLDKEIDLLISIGRHMSSTLNDLLDITSLHDNRVQLHKKPIKIQNLTNGITDMLEFMLDGKNITIETSIPKDFPTIFADENRLTQVLFNLLHNAIKYTETGGLITVTAEHNQKMATIHITDTGIGMDQQTISKIFEPYEQGKQKNHSISGGLGLGLSICKHLVEMHNGTIRVQSAISEGSTFSFTIPLVTEKDLMHIYVSTEVPFTDEPVEIGRDDKQTDNLIAATSQETINPCLPRILIVDDDTINLRILENLFANDYEITAVTSGKMALEQLDKGDWDLVISDVMMPNMSGYELTKEIRKRYTIAQLPVLLLTARVKPEDLRAGFEVGANDYVKKPMEATELSARVYAITGMKKSIKEQLKMEAAWLQAQIHPHFLYNTLNTIASLSHIDTERMVKLLTEFGKYLRHSFHIKNTDTVVPFEQEIKLVKSYLYIEKERFGKRLQIDWLIDEQLDIKIPPLSIQPLVENAVRHGVLQQMEGGTVTLKTEELDSFVRITIKDDGVGISKKRLKKIQFENSSSRASGVGVWNTNRRISQLYGTGLEIESVDGEGTTIYFDVPK